MKSFGRTVAGALMVCAGATSLIAAEPLHQNWVAPGLHQPARLVVDHWGVAHIYAREARDAFFLQGYNAARDRLWQIDLWRKRGLGLLSASFGPAYLAQDRAARLFLYRGDMTAEWASYAPGAREETEAFVAGINAYVIQVRGGERPLPVEFTLTQSQPGLWRADEVVRIRSHALVSNLLSEVARSQVVCAGGVQADSLRRKLEPAHEFVVPEGLDPCAVRASVLDDYVLATKAVAFATEQGKLAQRDLTEFSRGAAAEGSNNWVIGPDHSATGRPILANDPHRQLGVPSLRYLVHLQAPGLNLIGAGEPALPGVALGHNDRGAFGLTIFAIDQEDLYVYALNPVNPDQYRYGQGWETMTVVREAVPVKGEAAREVELRFTRHGPVLQWDAAHGRAFALRSVWNSPGASGYFQSQRLTHAGTWQDFRAAADHWGTPPLNLVWADTHGVIGWAAAGLTPKRPNWDGLLPVPGDGRYEWAGFLPGADLPSSRNPDKGWFATANQMDLPAGYPAEDRKVSFEWTDRSRIDRIETVLGAKAKISLEDSQALQTDSHSAMAIRLTRLLAPLSSADPPVQAALTAMKAWDRNETITSAAAAIYEVWSVKHLGLAVVGAATPGPSRPAVGAGSLDAVITLLEHPDGRLGTNPAAARDGLLLASLKAALNELTQRLGPDPSAWTWGALHHATFTPAVANLADPALRARMILGPLPLPGGASTPKAATWSPGDFNTIAGASVRMVIDVGDWDRSRFINTPGQAGDPADPHYGDLFPLWAHGEYAPLLYSTEAVEAAADRVITLRPALKPLP